MHNPFPERMPFLTWNEHKTHIQKAHTLKRAFPNRKENTELACKSFGKGGFQHSVLRIVPYRKETHILFYSLSLQYILVYSLSPPSIHL